MTKRTMKLVLGCMFSAVGLLAAAPAWSGVVNSRHDVATTDNTYNALRNLADFGTCSACHIPHGAGADKLFPSAGPTVTGGYFGPLCGSCHDSNVVGLGGLPNLNINTTVFAANAHGLRVADITAIGSDYDVAGGVLTKYLNLADSPRATPVNEIECLSCHDVHNQNSRRPFLYVTIESLCQECHTNRTIAAAANTGYANAMGNHPSGPLFTGDLLAASGVADGANSVFPVGLSARLTTITDTGANGSTWTDGVWNSGGHLEGGGVGCVTCHAVHFDENDATPDNGTFYLGFVDDGMPGVANLFCEECHQGALTIPADLGGGNAATRWNPGATQYSHPNDAVGAVFLQSANVPGLPLGLIAPTSSRVGTGASTLVCTSCHGVHRADATGPETQPNSPNLLAFGANTLTGAQVAASICTACHGATFPAGFNHHPVGNTVYATSGNTTGNVSCSGGDLASGLGTCHGGTGSGGAAHNRASSINVVDTNYSAMCVKCHTVNPSTYTTSTPYTASGTSSHFVGDAATGGLFAARSTTSGAGIRYAGSAVSTSPASTWSGSTLPSKWGANATTIICESCHTLKAGALQSGDGATRMLVEVSGSAIVTTNSDSTVAAADYTTAPYICTGCHLVPAGTHPLLNATANTYAISGGAGQSYTASSGGSMNCESCHSAHDADTDSGSYILDGGGTGTVTGGMEVEPPIDYTNFCAVCHSTFK